MNIKSTLLAAAASGILLGAVACGTNQAQSSDPSMTQGKHSCKGQNACKGQGGCKG